MMDLLTNIDLSKILALPWYVAIPGLAVAILFAWSAIWSLLTFRLVRALTRITLALVIVIILNYGGEAIVQLIEVDQTGLGK